ncbi:S46 family peptidase [Niabella ginsengisoli]|uniref:S46 family peptidase n=1 Tax=Niabella ginsengisoli TaxID=522298 RepID=UPI0021D412FD|nr:S46 family peptidase [Niabella ginsengisoli]
MTVNDPAKILIRDKALKVIDKYMREDESIKIQYASKYAGISNAWKKWQGEVLGLTNTKALDKKLKYEADYLDKLNNDAALKSEYGNVLNELNQTYRQIKPLRWRVIII